MPKVASKTKAAGKTSAKKTAAPAVVPLLSRLHAPEGAVRNEKRVGRGVGSGLGKTAGHGQKGQTARHKREFGKLGFEGGQTPLYRRIPKRGFHNHFETNVTAINLRDLKKFKSGATVDEASLREAGVINRKTDAIKLLTNGEID